MAKMGAGAGHGGNDPGAVSQGNIERDIARIMNRSMVSNANRRGKHVMYDLTVDKGYPYNVNEPVRIANANGVIFAIQNHFNAGGGNGVEVLYYAGDSYAANYAAKLSAAIASAYGLTNRGAKPRSNLGFINGTNMTAFIIEWGFVDAPNNMDCPKILADPDKGINAALDVLGFEKASAPAPAFSVYHSGIEDQPILDIGGHAGKAIKTLRFGEEVMCKPASLNWLETQNPKGYVRIQAMRRGKVPTSLHAWYPAGTIKVYAKKDTSSEVLREYPAGTKMWFIANYAHGWFQVKTGAGDNPTYGYVQATRI